MGDLLQKIISLAKRRGFIFPSSEIYGGFGSSYDFGPLGAEMKNNIKNSWRDEMLRKQNPPVGGIVVGLDSAIMTNPKVWQASGHLSAGFADELVECKKCHHRFRKDFLEKEECPDCGGEITQPRKFNLMMKTFVGALEDDSAMAYLRAETCQGIYVNFENIVNSMRLKIPFGVAQIGKSFRNEITPKDFIYRTREFEQMEMQWFCEPKDADKFFGYWKKERMEWYLGLGIQKDNLRLREVDKKELAHYAERAVDIEYQFPFGWKEIEGIHNRGDWDLSNHSKHSGKELKYEDYFPYIIETSGGVDRSFLAFLIDAYEEVKGGRTETTEAVKEVEIMLKLHKKIAPVKAAVLPLLKNKPELVKKAKEVYELLKEHFICQYDGAGSIGRRYRRQDEIGTVFCLTIDFETLEKDDLTIRDRDTMKQERVGIDNLVNILTEKLK